MKLRHIMAALAVACILYPLAALAQAVAVDTTVELPIGSWVETAGAFVGPLLAAAALWLIRKLPEQISAILITMRVDQMLEKAISYAINATVAASKDRPLSINVGNEVVAKAAQYVVDNGPGWLIGWMGGYAAIREKIIARLNVEEQAAIN